MDRDEILKQAKLKYPIGCIVDSLGGSGHQEIKHHDFYIVDANILRATNDCCLQNSTGRWAEIISKPNNNIEIW